ncbi:hypothetical protein [Taylorella equigenitalis]|uniref:Uncharacterized protein n=3 Tax=Taylorella equigenitalis TaxID=29575 RepID=A0A654KHQ1_TAYEM|nr:hypothetical protein [Taylorella equigenitalis]ADU91920.1 hypothetical protein TEQUI_0990 [Taylorella equigenitalis MCE9]AFN35483.1 hypothetical protein KUI_0391 [Taylorella equigenitalis ATCC 35865]ASY30137.1 hypothetical protein B9Z30_01815 [Taylorella equigenitalis]ASY37443.1 hypothetical protein CA605_01770 [Taylorella equigenitalis]ASY38912.1 hypothetical protein CA604_01940 [Taylorella equigenitalis]
MLSNLDQIIAKTQKVVEQNQVLFNERNRLRQLVSNYETQILESKQKAKDDSEQITKLTDKVKELEGFLESTQNIYKSEVKSLKERNRVLELANEQNTGTIATWKEEMGSIRSRVAHVLENISNDVQGE